MATKSKRLGARYVDTVTTPGMHADGDGLYLVVGAGAEPSKRWTFIFQWHGKRSELGLGKLSAVSLADARSAAENARRLVAAGQNPIDARRQAKADARAGAVDFGAFADALVEELAPGFRNSKHIDQWRTTLKVYALPLRSKRLDTIDTEAVLSALRPIWQSKPETASRVRGRIERVLDAAKVAGLRSGENPARWRGHLDAILPKRRKLTRGHHAAMPFADLPAFWNRLQSIQGKGALALRLLILTAARTSEITGARWSEIDLPKAVWVVPASRMKAGREHRVPLSAEAVAMLQAMFEVRTGDLLFEGAKRGRPISDATMTKALGAAGGADFTVHGFRSTFRDWVGEETSFPETLAEAALAHVVGDETERAYRRGDALGKRAKLMTAWASYCLSGNNVVHLARGNRA